jgi:hypothetical protein
MTYIENIPTAEQLLDLDSQTDNMRVQSYLEAWAKRHLADSDEERSVVEGMVELLQETL